jgi:hypothetical protein
VSLVPEAAVCAIDLFGNFVSTSMALGEGDHIEVLASAEACEVVA